MEFGICSWFGYKYTYEDRIKLIKNAGFQSVMTWWGEESKEKNEPKELKPEIIRRHGLKLENVHFPFNGIDAIWKDSPDGDELLTKYLLLIDDCKTHQIPTVVMHVTGGDNPPPYSQTGLDRFKRIIERAEKNGITIALENVWRLEYLDYIFDSIESGKLKFCYDSGHENCFTPGMDCLAKYGAKLAALHLHDNDGAKDQHQFPFSGAINWKRIITKIKELNYDGALALEIDAQYSGVLDEYTAEAYLNEARDRAGKLFDL